MAVQSNVTHILTELAHNARQIDESQAQALIAQIRSRQTLFSCRAPGAAALLSARSLTVCCIWVSRSAWSVKSRHPTPDLAIC